jgi:hypothetical protein
MDSGGTGNYGSNENYTMTFCGENEDACLFLEGTYDFWYDDHLYIYDGMTTDGFLIADLTVLLSSGFGSISLPSSCVTFQFVSNESNSRNGFDFNISCDGICHTCNDGIKNGYELATDCGGPDCEACPFFIISEEGTVNSCDARLLDPGANAPYGANQDYTMTFCGENGNECLILDGTCAIQLNDHLYIYDGTTTDGPLLADLTQIILPINITVPSPCVTFRFVTDDLYILDGFDINISCDGICPTCDDGIKNGYELAVDCGGPDCEPCDFLIINQGGTVNTCSDRLLDTGASGNYGDYENYSLSVCGDNGDECLLLDVTYDIGYIDHLYIYDGMTTGGFLIDDLTYSSGNTIISTPSSCVTFQFISDSFITAGGFDIDISCDSVCHTCDDGIKNGYEEDVDCGGPDCQECFVYLISEEGTIVTCDARLLDSGGPGNHGSNENYTMTFCGENGDECLLLDGTYNLYGGDHLYIYEGTSTQGELIADLTEFNLQLNYTIQSSCVTFQFVSSATFENAGFDINISCNGICETCDDGIKNGDEIGVDCGGPECAECDFIVMGGEQTQVTCATTIYDNGYLGNYSPNSIDVLTICSESPEDCIQLEFLQFDIHYWSILTIYDGPDIYSPVYAVLNGPAVPEFISTGGNCLTIKFDPNGLGNSNQGYEIAVSCICPTCDDGIKNGKELGVDCGGPDCLECDFIVMDENQTQVTCGTTIYDNGYLGNYSSFSNDVLTICGESGDECLLLTGGYNIGAGDHLYIYEGTDTDGVLIDDLTGNSGPFYASPPSSCVTFHFVSDGFVNNGGYEIDINCDGICPTCDDGILNGNEIGVDCGGVDCSACPCIGEEATLTIVLDDHPEETNWTITDAGGGTVISGGNYGSQPGGSTVIENFCLNDGCYTLDFFDSFGDGICCDFGIGSYVLTGRLGIVLASGGEFATTVSTPFCFDTSCQPPNNLDVVEIGFWTPNAYVNATWVSPEGTSDCEVRGGPIDEGSYLLGEPEFEDLMRTRLFNETNGSTLNSNIALYNNPSIHFVTWKRYGYEVRCQCADGSGYSEWANMTQASTFFVPPPPAGLALGTNKLIEAGVNEMSIYPNPAEGVVNIQIVLIEEGSVEILLQNALGQTVAQDRASGTSMTQRLDISLLEAGIYMMSVRTTSGIITERVIVK